MNLNNLNLNEKIEDLLAALKKKEDESIADTQIFMNSCISLLCSGLSGRF